MCSRYVSRVPFRNSSLINPCKCRNVFLVRYRADGSLSGGQCCRTAPCSPRISRRRSAADDSSTIPRSDFFRPIVGPLYPAPPRPGPLSARNDVYRRRAPPADRSWFHCPAHFTGRRMKPDSEVINSNICQTDEYGGSRINLRLCEEQSRAEHVDRAIRSAERKRWFVSKSPALRYFAIDFA